MEKEFEQLDNIEVQELDDMELEEAAGGVREIDDNSNCGCNNGNCGCPV